jgi:addiction module HigA family antidote
MKPVHPGEHLREDFLKPYGISMNRLAMDLRVPVTRIADIVAERRGISSDTALRLGRYFKTSPEFWMNMQMKFDLDVAEDKLKDEIRRDVRPMSSSRASCPHSRDLRTGDGQIENLSKRAARAGGQILDCRSAARVGVHRN